MQTATQQVRAKPITRNLLSAASNDDDDNNAHCYSYYSSLQLYASTKKMRVKKARRKTSDMHAFLLTAQSTR